MTTPAARPSAEAQPDELFGDRDLRASITLRVATGLAEEFGRPVVLTQTDARHLLAEVAQLRAAVVALARLASPTPEFSNPLTAWEAQALRDRVLADVPHFLALPRETAHASR